MLIATHDGSFHADETIACAILTYLYENSQIIRSRDPNILEKADIIIDVSGKNDEKHFDHHSKEFNLCRDNGIAYATAGLMWKKFGLEFLNKINKQFKLEIKNQEIIQKAFDFIDKNIMIYIDLNDNGQLNEYLNTTFSPQNSEEKKLFDDLNLFYQQVPSIPYIVATQNINAGNNEDQYKAFISTVKLLKQILIGACNHCLNTQRDIVKVLECYKGGNILILHEKLPWSQAVLENMNLFKDCLIAIYPDRKRGWRIQSLPYSKAEIFKNKCSAPIEWRGLDNEALDKKTGLKNTIFVHRSGFTGGAITFEDALEMAKLWIEKGVKI